MIVIFAISKLVNLGMLVNLTVYMFMNLVNCATSNNISCDFHNSKVCQHENAKIKVDQPIQGKSESRNVHFGICFHCGKTSNKKNKTNFSV